MSENDSIWSSKTMWRSKAYQELNGTAIKVLNEFHMRKQMKRTSKRSKKFLIKNNGELVFTYKEALNMGFTRPTFTKALDSLIDRGFIDIAYQGGGLMGDFSKYAISERWEKYGTDNFIVKVRKKNHRKVGFLNR